MQGDERRYNLKEDKLASVLTKALAINPTSTDGIRLKKYKQPVAHNEVLFAGKPSQSSR